MLRPIQPEDLPLIWEWATRHEMKEFFRRFPPLHIWHTQAGAAQVLQHCSLICDGEKPVGLASLGPIDMLAKRAEYGGLVDKTRGGNARHCLDSFQEVAEYAFNYLGLERIYAHVLPHREDVAHILRKAGATCEGTLRRHLFWNGSFHDELLFSLLASEWRALSEHK